MVFPRVRVIRKGTLPMQGISFDRFSRLPSFAKTEIKKKKKRKNVDERRHADPHFFPIASQGTRNWLLRVDERATGA